MQATKAAPKFFPLRIHIIDQEASSKNSVMVTTAQPSCGGRSSPDARGHRGQPQKIGAESMPVSYLNPQVETSKKQKALAV